jgi:hypothetical protein
MNHIERVSLFSAQTRTDTNFRSYAEPRYAFLDRAAGAPWQRIRETLDSWFARLPVAAQREIRVRFSSDDDLHHLGAFWELWVHEAHRRLGWNVTVHVGTEPGERRQDFEVERDGERFWIEATVVAGDSLVKRPDQKRHAQLCDLINTVRAPGHFVGLEVLSHGPKTPRRKQVVGPIERWLGESAPAPTLCLEFDGWKIKLKAITANRPHGEDHRVLGIQTQGTGRADDLSPLRRKIRNKAGRYGETDRPYLLAILALGDTVDDIDIGDALLGTSAVVLDPHSDNIREIRKRDGAWFGPRGPQNTRLSGVLIARGLVPHGIATTLPILLRNPWAAHPLDDDFPWHTIRWNDAGDPQISAARIDASALFDFPDGWPEAAGGSDG